MSLGKVYYDPKHAAVFGSAAKLVKAGEINKTAVDEWLSGQDTYTLHKPVRKRFPRCPGNGSCRFKLCLETQR